MHTCCVIHTCTTYTTSFYNYRSSEDVVLLVTSILFIKRVSSWSELQGEITFTNERKGTCKEASEEGKEEQVMLKKPLLKERFFRFGIYSI